MQEMSLWQKDTGRNWVASSEGYLEKFMFLLYRETLFSKVVSSIKQLVNWKYQFKQKQMLKKKLQDMYISGSLAM